MIQDEQGAEYSKAIYALARKHNIDFDTVVPGSVEEEDTQVMAIELGILQELLKN